MEIQLSDVYLDEKAFDIVSEVLRSKNYISGDYTRRFEREFAKKFNVRSSVAVSSGTAALSLIYEHLGLQPGDEVIAPSFSFVATITPFMHLGAKPVFADVDSETLTIDPDDLRKKITSKTKAIVPVHLFGHPAAMDEIMEIARQNSIEVVEDACQAHGAMLKGQFVGSFGKAAGFSFYPSKNMTVYGDGGMIATNDEELAADVSMLRDHGRVSKYIHQKIGYNLRMSELSAALGSYQLKKLDSFNEGRRRVARFYDHALKGYAKLPVETRYARHVYHMYAVRTKRRDALKDFLLKNGIHTGIHYPIPIHQQPAVASLIPPMKLPKTEEASKTILSIPIHPRLSEEELHYVASKVRAFSGKLVSVPPAVRGN